MGELRILAEQPGDAVLIADEAVDLDDLEAEARVYDLQTKVLHPPFLLHAIVKRGYWIEPTLSDDELERVLGEVRERV